MFQMLKHLKDRSFCLRKHKDQTKGLEHISDFMVH